MAVSGVDTEGEVVASGEDTEEVVAMADSSEDSERVIDVETGDVGAKGS